MSTEKVITFESDSELSCPEDMCSEYMRPEDMCPEDPLAIETPEETTEMILPQKSKEKYLHVYNKFVDWKAKKKVQSLSENVMLTYFKELSRTNKPSTLASTYSMLRTTLNANNNINIQNYDKLVAFVKKQSQGFQSKKKKILTTEQIKKFLDEASDDTYLFTKVAIIFGTCGKCRIEELSNMTINDIEDKQNVVLVKIPTTKNYKPRSFLIPEEFYNIFRKYIALRPKDIQTSKFFLNYRNGKCSSLPIGINKFGRLTSTVASYLKLPEPQSYSSRTFRSTFVTNWQTIGLSLR